MLDMNLIKAMGSKRGYEVKKVNTDEGDFIVIQNKNDVHDWCEFKVSETSNDEIINRMRTK